MADYWKSQPKKFCDFCKVWITDNKPSVEFHERGKKHKENVQLKIVAVRKKGMQTVKDNDEFKQSMAAIEAAALQAYKKDLGIEESESDTTANEAQPRPRSAANEFEPKPRPSVPATTTPVASVGETSATDKPSSGCTIVYHDSQPVAECCHFWSVAQSPEGYYYYYNSQTQITQWDIPQCLQSNDSDDSKEQTKEGEESSEEEDVGTATPSPYGSWTTVRVIEKPAPTSKSEKEGTADQDPSKATEDPEETAKKTENKFKEKETPKIAFQRNDTEVVAFKKRKLNSDRKRNIRQTKFNS